MTTYRAVCNASSRDVIEAHIEGDSIELVARSYGEHKMETYLDVDKARAFARGILALADKIDGGGVTEGPKADEPAPSPFAAHVDEAKRLLDGTGPTAADIIRLAEILAGR